MVAVLITFFVMIVSFKNFVNSILKMIILIILLTVNRNQYCVLIVSSMKVAGMLSYIGTNCFTLELFLNLLKEGRKKKLKLRHERCLTSRRSQGISTRNMFFCVIKHSFYPPKDNRK